MFNPIMVAEGGSAIGSGVTELMGYVSTMLTTITGNSVLVLFLAGSVLGTAIGIFRKLKRAAK